MTAHRKPHGRKPCPIRAEKIARVSELLKREPDLSISEACRREDLNRDTYCAWLARSRERERDARAWAAVGKPVLCKVDSISKFNNLNEERE